MNNLGECQLPCLARIAEGPADVGPQPLLLRLKRTFARPWNYVIKSRLKRFLNLLIKWRSQLTGKSKTPAAVKAKASPIGLKAGDKVRVRSREEIEATLDAW